MIIITEYAIPEATRTIEKAGAEVYRTLDEYRNYLKCEIKHQERIDRLAEEHLAAHLNFDVEVERVIEAFLPYSGMREANDFIGWLIRYRDQTELFKI